MCWDGFLTEREKPAKGIGSSWRKAVREERERERIKREIEKEQDEDEEDEAQP
jgi:hypothetical protein